MKLLYYLLNYYIIVTGDAIHLIVGNHNHVFSALGGIWILGGVGSVGDTALDPKAIAGQVSYEIKQDWKPFNLKRLHCTALQMASTDL